ncbi:MAG: ATP-binding protein [Lachnospiraceae bacterium]|nr:ATP-binding protein [Lachnospiraceae bacterium]MDD3796773.1 ATP-binding protein [Lachnospiraceae bacterium]
MKKIEELILYRGREDELLTKLAELMNELEKSEERETLKNRYFACMQELLEIGESHGFAGNLWHCYLTYLLVYHENAYSKACEIRGSVEGGINQIALHDFQIFMGLFATNFHEIEEKLQIFVYPMIADYGNASDDRKIFNRRIRDRICTLSVKLAQTETPEEFKKEMEQFYREFGVGKFGLHKAFRIQHTEEGAKIIPITNIAHVYLDDLVGYEIPKQKLIDNTEAFVNGKRANNCLLFGDAGTGKSSSIKGILNRYYDRGLRIIEVYKHQFQDLNDIIAQIKNRNYKFIIYMDDLSFEEFEIEYKYLKAVIEGGLEKKPDNILIYATSNRRHLIKESFADKEGRRADMHSSDTVQEKLSLVYRFGVSIFFCAPNKKEFQNIVKVLAEKYQVTLPEEELLQKANQWELSHGGLSGRTAQQFIDHLLGKPE